MRARISAVDDAGSIADFSDIDFDQHEKKIAALEEERQAIEEQSDAITLLKQRLAETEARQMALQRARDEVVAEERELENHISQAEKLIANAHADLRRRERDGTLAQHRSALSI